MVFRLRYFSLIFSLLLIFLFPSCDCADDLTGKLTGPCEEDSDCATGVQCVDGFCQGDSSNGGEFDDVGDDILDVEDNGGANSGENGIDNGGEVDDCPDRPTCEDIGAECGSHPDGCGGTIQCGGCGEFDYCGSGEDSGRCMQCVPKTCADYNANCGILPDGCGGTIECGGCTAPEICGGSGMPNVCGAENTGPCQGELCEHQRFCLDNKATTLTGVVYAPNGEFILPNATVYVPGVPLEHLPPIDTGAICQRCEDEDLGAPIAGAITDANGRFEIRHVPSGVPFPLVIKIGKWRRVVMIDPVTECETTALPKALTSLAGSMSPDRPHDNIPKTAVVTGRVDAMECVLRKLGVVDTEFTRHTQDGAIHMYRSNGATPDQELANACSGVCSSEGCTDHNQSCGGSTLLLQHLAHHLYSDQARLNSYDMVIYDCDGQGYREHYRTPYIDNMKDYLDSGGRLYVSHFAHDWMRATPEFSGVYDASAAFGMFDTPVSAPAENQCGRVAYSRNHVTTGPGNNGRAFPGYCATTGLTNNERELAKMLFDLGACISDTGEPPPPVCEPQTCESAGAECGQISEGCGGPPIDCGSCAEGLECGAQGQPNICGEPCTVLSCEDHGAECGQVFDGCGEMLNCGECEGEFLCEERICVPPPCRPAGEECESSGQCCSRICGGGICVVN